MFKSLKGKDDDSFLPRKLRKGRNRIADPNEVLVLSSHKARKENELTVKKGDVLLFLGEEGHMLRLKDKKSGKVGLVHGACIRRTHVFNNITISATGGEKKQNKFVENGIEESCKEVLNKYTSLSSLTPRELVYKDRFATYTSLHEIRLWGSGDRLFALFDYTAEHSDDLNVRNGELFEVISIDSSGWIVVQNSKSEKGLIPGNIVKRK